MKKSILIILTLLLSTPTFAADKRARRLKLKNMLTKSRWELSLGYNFWQENFEVTDGSAKDTATAHFDGLGLELHYLKPSKSSLRWIYTFSAFSHVGQAYGTTSGTVTADLKNQSWGHFGVIPGFLYRTSLGSEFGIRVPLGMRTINWYVDDTSQVEIDKASSFSYGVSAVMVNRINKRSSITASVTHLMSWETTRWDVGWQIKLF